MHHLIFVNKDLVHSLLWWSDRFHLSQRMPFTFPNTTITITMDASIEGWGSQCIVPGLGTALFSNIWSVDKHQLHINVLELRAVCLTLLHLEQDVNGQSILIESDNMATVSYINKQGGVVFKTLNDETYMLFQWLIPRLITVRVIHRPGVNNELADFLSRNCPDPTEWHLSESGAPTIPTVEHP